jgi:glycosyltransferase involved in cell wall biosynthesis
VLLTKKELLNWPELTNIVVIHNPLAFFPERTSNCEKKKVIAVGRYVREKGFDLLIDAWNIVHQKHPEWELHIYGNGKNDQLKEQINSLRLNTSCYLEESVKNIEEKYIESSIFVLSSRNEGFGMVIAEAMACGIPPVSFACDSGPDEIIHDKEDGFLVEPENIMELAEKICYLIENEDERKILGENARRNIERLKIENIAGQWIKVFDDLTDIQRK